MSTLLALSRVILIAAVLSACGGDGGVRSGGARGDTTRPAVSATVPARDATDVAVNAPLTVTFSEAMKGSTITASTFYLDRGVSAEVTYDAAGRIATLAPLTNLAYATTYTATLTTGIEDVSGNALAATYAWSFSTIDVPDTTAPRVTATDPVEGATGVSPSAVVSVTFSEAMDPATLDTTTFALTAFATGAPVAGTVTTALSSATFTPAAPLGPGTKYQATITTGVRDLAQNPMAVASTWSFTTEPVVLGRVNGDTSPLHRTPVIAFNSDGTTGVAVWVEDTGAGTRLLHARYSGGMWHQEAELAAGGVELEYDVASDGSGFMVVYIQEHSVYAIELDGAAMPTPSGPTLIRGDWNSGPSIAAGGAGQYLAAWPGVSPSGWRAFASGYSGAWSSPEAVSNTAGSVFHQPSIASRGGGEYAVAWRQTNGSIYSIYANIFTSLTAATADAATLLESDETNHAYGPRITTNGTSYAVAWNQMAGSRSSIFANVSQAGAFSAANAALVEIDDAGAAQEPGIAAAGADYAIAWLHHDGLFHSVFANVSQSGVWDPAQATVVEIGEGHAGYPVIASNGTEYAIVWPQYDGTTTNIYANVSAGGAWNAANATLVEGSTGSASGPRVARQGLGFAVTWTLRSNSGTYSLFAGSYTGEWAAEVDLVQGDYTGSSRSPAIATNDYGETLVVWLQANSGVTRLYGRLLAGSGWSNVLTIEPQVDGDTAAVASNGTDFMVVYASNGMWARTCDRLGTLGPRTDVRDPASLSHSEKPKIASSQAGYAVTWLQYVNDVSSVYANVYEGGGWSGAVLLENTDSWASQVAVASNGTDHAVAWAQQSRVWANMASGTSWSSATLLDNSTNADSPAIASNGSGYAVVWRQVDSDTYNIYANLFSTLSPTTKDSSTLIESGADHAGGGGLAVAANGTAYLAAWIQPHLAVERVYTNLFDTLSATSQNAAVPISSGYFDASALSAAANGHGFAVAWQSATTDPRIYASIHDGMGWQGPMLALSSEPAGAPSLAANGAAYAACFLQRDPTDALVNNVWANLTVASEPLAAGTLADPIIIAADPNNNTYSLPWNGTIGASVLYFKMVGLLAGNTYTVTLSGLTDNADLVVYADGFVTPQCASAQGGSVDEFCDAPTTPLGELYLHVDGRNTVAGTTFFLEGGT